MMSECINCAATDDEENGIVVGLQGELNETVCNVCRTEELVENTVLSEREAQVAALKELIGAKHDRIAEILDLEKSTVDEYSRRMRDKFFEAGETVEQLQPII